MDNVDEVEILVLAEDTVKIYGYYIEMSVRGIHKTLFRFVSIYTIYSYKAGD